MDHPAAASERALAAHRAFLTEAVALARSAREAGNHPFGALLVRDGRVVARAENRVVSDGNPLRHAEMTLLERAHRELGEVQLAGCTLYSSTEPCAMCGGAIYWSGVRRIVFALPASTLAELAGGHFVVPCATLLAGTREPVEIIGPLSVAGAREVHEGYWNDVG